MFGMEIRIISASEKGIAKMLEELMHEVEGGATNAYFPLNDQDKTEADFQTLDVQGLGLYDSWARCTPIDRWED